jgi:hypothetical protein
LLLPQRHVDVLYVVLVVDETSVSDLVAGFFVHLANGAIQVPFVLVDLAPGEAPAGTLLPSLDENGLVHGVIEQDGSSDGDSGFVG